jgi:hypothetical protein
MVEPGYYTVKDLLGLGWTRGLIDRYLGPPDRRFPVDHWLNWSGKKAWRIDWVELAEMTQGFETGFLRSARIRYLPDEEVEKVIDRIYAAREQAPFHREQIEDDWTRRMNACASSAADLINSARAMGYRTPHKC